MSVKVKVRSSANDGSDWHDIEGDPNALAHKVNMAIKRQERFVTFEIPGNKKLSLIADRIEAIWEE